MKSVLTTICLILHFGLYAQVSQVSFDQKRLKRLSDWLSTGISEGKLHGAAVMIADHDEVIFQHVEGVSNIETQRKMEIDDYFRLASMSKVITTVAALQLYERGLFNLDDPVSEYIPEMGKVTLLDEFVEEDTSFTTKPLQEAITIRHLLNQTSGIPYGGPAVSKIHKSSGFDDLTAHNANLEEFVEALVKIPTVSEPGTEFTYGHSTDVLGLIIEKLSGQDLESYLDENIFKPLGMKHTGFNVHMKNYEKLVKIYGVRNGKFVLAGKSHNLSKGEKVTLYLGGSQLIGTPQDYLVFIQMLLNNGELNGQRIISRKSIEMMATDQLGPVEYPEFFQSIVGKGNTFGLGVNVVTKEGSANELYGEGVYFWEGAYCTTFIIDPVEKFVALFMTQQGGRAVGAIRKDFRKFVYQALN